MCHKLQHSARCVPNDDWTDMTNDEQFVAWACSAECQLPAGLAWDDPQVLLAKSAWNAGRAIEKERCAEICDAYEDDPENNGCADAERQGYGARECAVLIRGL